MIFAELQKLKSIKILLVIGLPYIIYLFHVLLFGKWIIDDAGISFVYSRNLVEGFGLVSQPGVEPVEGYSNFTWIFLFAPFLWLKLFHPIFIPKLISVLLVLFSFIALYKTLRLISINPITITFICLTLLSLNTSFVVWTCSGLENPLYVFLTTLLLNQMVKLSLSLEFKTTISAAVITALLAMTRPDGILYLFVSPIFLLSSYFLWKESMRTTAVNFFLFTLIFTLLFGSFFIFRLYYFGNFFPNTYYAKGGPSYFDLKNLLLLKPRIYGRISELFGSVLSYWGDLFFFGLLIATIYFVSIGRFTKQYFIVLLVLVFSVFIYVLLPPDWMEEFRFATPFYPIFYTYLFILCENVNEKLNWQSSRKLLIAVILVIIFIGPSIIDFINRSYQFRNKPTVPFLMVVNRYSKTFDNYAALLNVKNGSFLLPDVGGTLYYSALRIYDLSGLTDKTIARTLEKKQIDFYDYVFKIIKPTFIHTHGVWSYRAKLDSDKRFREDYIPLRERIEPRMVKRHNGLKIYSGDYVRKDILDDNLEILQQIVQLAKTSK